ncbi:hypothetical protein BHM03_00038440 [Ensete ventricosum]|nr:hypothetical protein BHM03_00038440 [Ensete ventricosum]
MHSPLLPSVPALLLPCCCHLRTVISLFPFSRSEHRCQHNAASLYRSDLSLPSLSQRRRFPLQRCHRHLQPSAAATRPCCRCPFPAVPAPVTPLLPYTPAAPASASTTILFLNCTIPPQQLQQALLPTRLRSQISAVPSCIATAASPPASLATHPEAISLLNRCHFSSSLPPPLLPSPAPASLLPSRCCCSPQQGSTTPPEPSLPTHSSVAAASDRHILLKGHRLCCLAYHTAAFSSSSRTLLCRCLCPAALYLSFSFLLPSSPPAATTASFSPSAATTFMQPCPRQLGSLQPQPLPTPTLLLSSPCHASSSSTLAVVSIINAAASFAISAAPISTLPLPVTAALSHSRRRFAAFQR